MLTFNAAAELPRCIAALQRQSTPPSAILVVDNHGDPPPELAVLQALGSVEVRLLELTENLGPAGGFAEGLEQFLRTQHARAWVMDDDVEPAPDCLEQLLRVQQANGGEVVVTPLVDDFVNATMRSQDSGWTGVLIPRRAVEIAGTPRADFFWGSEDAEYLQDRLPHAGFPTVRCDDAVVRVTVRPTGSRKPAWKYYYEVRNRTYRYLYVRADQPFHVRLKSLTYWLAQKTRESLAGRQRVRNFALLLRGLFDGVLRRLGRRVRPGLPDRPFDRRE